ncbi:hypothetical protein BGZ80_006797 [Entomortierella chlamydospora]|uniref:MULE transposase domain-containing protein n=1 Tax=Entomortierella chlamydospora TaxID=101097 RepID=A0A9P6SSX2_9FUNG|nr:hypothetical protein BGZ80_006797 [Entomortierella chlamydospora]
MSEPRNRSKLFNLREAIVVPTQEFKDEIWPLISNVWTQFARYKSIKGETSIIFACRLAKHRDSSSRQAGISSKKRRLTSVRAPMECKIKIRVVHTDADQMTCIERYDETPDHCHTLEDSDKVKRPQAVRQMMINEARKAYRPPAIVVAVKDLAAGQGLEEVNPHISRKEVSNIQATVRSSELTRLIGNADLEHDIHDALQKLRDMNYQVIRFDTDGDYEGFCFAGTWQLGKLGECGWLTLMDSTHKTNRYDWRLFTLYVRDSYGTWCIGAHFFFSGEDESVVTKGLRTIRQLQPKWEPRYILCDQSAIENRAINNAFPGITRGEQNYDVILCTVHVMRAWMRNIPCHKTRNKMIAAMHKKTKIGCNQLIQEAIRTCPLQTTVNYIKRNYSKNTEKWALHARQHSSLLLQVTTTNPLESFHSELKRIMSKHHGLFGE